MNSDDTPRLWFPAADSAGRDIYTVARLNREVCALLEGEFASVRVEGELSNLAAPSSGHLYFSLKDAEAQVRCAMFRSRRQTLRFRPADGARVVLRARVSLYQPRGDYQLIVEHMEEAGDGALRRAFEELKARLASEGLFAAERKRALPELPHRIGVITSPTGAAVRDVLTVLRRRFPAIPVLIYPVPVQGRTAGAEIARSIRLASERRDCDVLILCRGGGSLEDLWAFNEEVVARAIADCDIPLVSGVGHETDFTIADFVSDLRAPTPSGAAECVSPDGAEWLRHYARLEARIASLAEVALERRGERLQWLAQRLHHQHPAQRLRQQAQRVDELERRAARALHALLERRNMQLRETRARLLRHSPLPAIRSACNRAAAQHRHLLAAMYARLERLRGRLEHRAGALEALSPLATLARGYAVVRQDDGRVLVDARNAAIGEEIDARLARGSLRCRVLAATDGE
ncbi:MAG: exodeoxyribonuclease VII large subunit [Gammaproteobacteria bacterium]|jgi:exodeoxyribonuclease VII large subunit|nr:exodeoxyribonuclease VII large subunit [Gammaproteobacteria bacterium]